MFEGNTAAVPGPASDLKPGPQPLKEKGVILIVDGNNPTGHKLIRELDGLFYVVGLAVEELPVAAPADLIKMDTASTESVKQALEQVRIRYGGQIASVIHLASIGQSDFPSENPIAAGVERLLDALQGFKVEQFIFSSTYLMYKSVPAGTKITEESPLEPSGNFGQTLAEAEATIRQKHGPIPLTVLRIAELYSDEGSSPQVIHLAQQIYERKVINEFNSKSLFKEYTYVHVDDLVNALVKVVGRRKRLPPELVLNIGENSAVSFEELYQDMIKLLAVDESKIFAGIEATVQKEEETRSKYQQSFIQASLAGRKEAYVLDSSKAKLIVGWEPKHALLQTLPVMLNTLRWNPLYWYQKNKLNPPADFIGQDEEKPAGG